MKRMSAPPSSMWAAQVWRRRWQRPLIPREGVDLGQGEGAAGQALLGPWEFEFAGGIVEDDVLPGQPSEPVLQDAEPVALGAPTQTPAAGTDEFPEPALVGFQDGAGDVAGPREIAFGGPSEEVAEGVVAALAGLVGVIAGAEGFQIGVAPHGQGVRGPPVEVLADGDVAAPPGFRATGQFRDGFNAFGSGHGCQLSVLGCRRKAAKYVRGYDYTVADSASALMCEPVTP